MNKTTISALFILFLALVSCGKKEEWVPTTGAKVDLTLSIVSSTPSTKTAFEAEDGGTFVRWTAEDKLNVMFDSWNNGDSPLYIMSNSSTGTGSGNFQGMARDIEDGSHNVYAFATNGGFELKAPQKVLFNVKDAQNPGKETFDPDADIVTNRCYHLVVKAGIDNATITDMRFHRLLSTVMVGAANKTSKDLSGETIRKITLESKAQDIALTGSVLYDFESDSFGTESANPKVTANLSSPIAFGAEEKACILIAPVTLPKGSTLVATFETQHYRITKTVSLPQDMPFHSDKSSNLSLNLQDTDTVIENL
ncbi:MAG: hypothetical protein IK052_04345 [Bacteroidales bacterium]|nr:hypothetical protein [Bacteroidales bacterium]